MNLRFLLCVPCFLATCVVAPAAPAAPAPDANAASLADVEAQKCQDKIATVQRDVLSHYDDGLQELQSTFQKSADLEGALAVRTERQRLATEGGLTEKNYVNDPKLLRTLQTQTVSKLHELVSQLIQESVPRLIELKKSLTMAGKLDEAVSVRNAIEQLQGTFLPTGRVDPGTAIAADLLLQAFQGDRPHADKQYKGQRITVRGVLGGYRQDPADSKVFLLYLAGSAGTAWVQCAFPVGEFRFREEKQFANTVLVITTKEDSGGIRVQKGQSIDVRGICEGWDEVVKLAKCDLPK